MTAPTTTKPVRLTLTAVLARLEELGATPHQTSAGRYVARCVLHDDDTPSMSLGKGTATAVLVHCFVCGGSSSGAEFFARFVARLADDTRLAPPSPGARAGSGGSGATGTPVASYDYINSAGVTVAKKTRYERPDGGKSFGWSRPVGPSWASGLGMAKKVETLPLYRLPDLVNPGVVYVVEGEKDADNGAAAGWLCTSSAAGAGGHLPDNLEALVGRDVVVIADNDRPGHKHAIAWSKALTPIAASVRIALPGIDEPKADLSDHLAAGLGPESLRFVGQDVTLLSVLDDTVAWLRTYVTTRSMYGITLVALWIAHCHAMEAWYTTPRLLVTSALPGCGKTTLLEHVEHLTNNALMGSNATPALLARITKAGPRPILLDETDNLLDRKREGIGDLMAMLNSGYKKSGTRPVLVPIKGGDFRPEVMPTYAPVAFAGIGDHLPDATLSRSIVVHLDRAGPGAVRDSDWQFIEADAFALRDRLTMAVAPLIEVLAKSRPDLPVRGRDAEVWRPFFALAEAAGGHWPITVRDALADTIAESKADRDAGLTRDRPSLSLLRDLREVWSDGEGFVPTESLIYRLAAHNPEMWGTEARFGQIKPKRLASLLGDYGLRPDRNSDRLRRGYLRHDIEKAWATYLSDDPSNVSNPSEASAESTLSPDALDALDALDTSPVTVTCRDCGGPLYVADILAESEVCMTCVD